MVQILKKRSGFTIVEILVATIILSIGALAFFAMVKSVTAFSQKARSNDAAYSIARQRLSLMQDGEILVRPEYRDTVSRDGILYHTLDQVDTVSADQPLRLTVTVSWGDSLEKSVQISGYLNREICPDTGATTPPESLSISNATIPEDAPSNTLIGELTVYDPDSSDLHMYLFSDTVKDNECFKVSKGKLYTAKPLTVGIKTVELGVSDCAGNKTKFDLRIDVTPKDSVPHMNDQAFTIAENSIAGKVVGKVLATPLNVTFSILSQTPVSPFSIGTSDGTLMVGSSAGLNYEAHKTITVLVEVTNLQWHDTGIVTVTLTNVNEAPTKMVYSGSQSKPLGTAVGTVLGSYTITDPDSGDNTHIVSIMPCEASPYFSTNASDSKRIEVGSPSLVVGSFIGIFKATDAGGLFMYDTLLLQVTDTTSATPTCGSFLPYKSTLTYNNGDRAYFGATGAELYVYQAKWWTQSEPSLSNSAWKFIEACDGTARCVDFTAYQNGHEYNGGDFVSHAGKIWTTNTYCKNKVPPTSPWQAVSPCN